MNLAEGMIIYKYVLTQSSSNSLGQLVGYLTEQSTISSSRQLDDSANCSKC